MSSSFEDEVLLESTMRNDGDAPEQNYDPTSKRPRDTALRQQRMVAWHPILDPAWVICGFFLLGAVMVPTGWKLRTESNRMLELTQVYDGTGNVNRQCAIGSVANKMWKDGETCEISFTIPEDVNPPIYIHYEITNFYQNHRKYVESLDAEQLRGKPDPFKQAKLSADNCKPLNKLGDTYLNPCGLVANTFFNDVISLKEGQVDTDQTPLVMLEDGIAWQSDLRWKFRQPSGFRSEPCSGACDASCCEGDEWSCDGFTGLPYQDIDGICYKFDYPFQNITQYLYQTYPMAISPLDGVTNEHFVVWMREAALQKFRKLYGWINQPIKAGTVLTFEIMSNWIVDPFGGSKGLIISTSGTFGGRNDSLGDYFTIIGYVCLGLGVAFGIKHLFKPRKLGHIKYLRYKTH